MKRFILTGILGLLMLVGIAGASSDVRESLIKSMQVFPVDVSTETATVIQMGGANLAGRTSIKIINTENAGIYISTQPAVTTGTGFLITGSSKPATSTIKLPLGANRTLYGIGVGHGSEAEITINVIEISQ